MPNPKRRYPNPPLVQSAPESPPSNAGEGVSEFVVRKDIPLPGNNSRNSELNELLRTLEIGDCVDLPFPRYERANVAAMAYRVGIRLTTRLLITRPDGTGQIDTLRIWRTK